MTLASVAGRLFAFVGVMLLVGIVVIVGRRRLFETRRSFDERFIDTAPYLGVFVLVLFANRIARDVVPEVSWLFGFRITGRLQQFDGWLPGLFGHEEQLIVVLQSYATPELTAYFSFVYVYGYVFLLVFPLVAYFALEERRPLRRTIVAYGANYCIGVVCYGIFVALGPRNLEIGQGLLYEVYPQYQFLTTAINSPTNVFPSLHTSLAVTAALLAVTTRDEYPLWTPVACLLAGSVVVSTMYLGIHWSADVIAGIVLAGISVGVARRFDTEPKAMELLRHRLLTAVTVGRDRLRG
ncbi:MAG: phosphatase PAP2 family protein [Natronomonas sp.]